MLHTLPKMWIAVGQLRKDQMNHTEEEKEAWVCNKQEVELSRHWQAGATGVVSREGLQLSRIPLPARVF